IETARGLLTDARVIDLEAKGALRGLGVFDVVICADLLEHLFDPWTTLVEFRSLIAPGGSLILSVPNVRHLTVVAPLLVQGRWEYADSGLLDITHVRFFTEGSIRSMLGEAAYEIVALRRWAGRPLAARAALRLAIGPLRGLFTYQYLLR